MHSPSSDADELLGQALSLGSVSWEVRAMRASEGLFWDLHGIPGVEDTFALVRPEPQAWDTHITHDSSGLLFCSPPLRWLCLLHHLYLPPSQALACHPSVCSHTWPWHGSICPCTWPWHGSLCLSVSCSCLWVSSRGGGSICLALILGVTHFPCSLNDMCSLYKPPFLHLWNEANKTKAVRFWGVWEVIAIGHTVRAVHCCRYYYNLKIGWELFQSLHWLYVPCIISVGLSAR